MKAFQKTAHTTFTNLIVLLLAIVMFVIVLSQLGSGAYVQDTDSYEMTTQWQMEDGQVLALAELPAGEVTVTHSLEGMDLREKRFCLKSSDTFLSVQADGVQVYEYAPVYPPILGVSYGNYLHMIPLPADVQTLTMTLTPAYDGDTADLRSVVIEDPAKYLTTLYRQGLPAFIACLVMVGFGIVMMLLEVTGGSTATGQPMGFLPLGVFSVLIGIWSMNDTFVLQSFTQHPEIIKIACYLCILLIAYPPVSFIATAAKRWDSKLLPSLAGLMALNLVSTLILSGAGIVDPHYMLMFSHFNILVAMCMTVWLMVQASRNKTIERKFLLTIMIGMTAALVGVGIDLLRFWFVKNSEYGSSLFTSVGVLIFLIAEGAYLLGEKNRMLIEQGNAELMKKLAYSDALTELGSRTAYYQKEEALRKSEQSCMIVMLDINWLKKVNDTYGHAAGDQHIIAAATVIRDCLGGLGSCYRTGGDEFAAILDTDDSPTVEAALHKMEDAQKAYNATESPPVPLQIAYGYAMYDPKHTALEIAENTADERMYEMKRRMKAIR